MACTSVRFGGELARRAVPFGLTQGRLCWHDFPLVCAAGLRPSRTAEAALYMSFVIPHRVVILDIWVGRPRLLLAFGDVLSW